MFPRPSSFIPRVCVCVAGRHRAGHESKRRTSENEGPNKVGGEGETTEKRKRGIGVYLPASFCASARDEKTKRVVCLLALFSVLF
mmetsp:Transcript_27254/g.53515  ORF Transcript_27254/g.53515 Transcript_27254/m.53515 type:complete len:85 (-) Transcript_27254:1306-1560(-)